MTTRPLSSGPTKRWASCTALLAAGAMTALVSTGCADTSDSSIRTVSKASTGGYPVYTAPAASDVCTGKVRVGRVAYPATCPSVTPTPGNPWEGGPLFNATAPPLGEYCVYEWKGGSAAVDPLLLPLDPVTGDDATVWTDADCAAISGQSCPTGPTLADQVAELLASGHTDRFHQQLDLAPSGALSPPAPVKVSVLDSHPTTGGYGAVFEHGQAMQAIIENAACIPTTGASCGLTTEQRLVLDRTEPEGDALIDGGYYGYLTTLAKQIEAASAGGGGGNLVINLSLGWDGIYNASSGGVRAEGFHVQAVRDALDHARCAGALVVASAGNTTGGSAPTSGPLYPAAWLTETTSCTGQPLVLAVGGVDGEDEKLANHRDGAWPPLVAASHEGIGLINMGGHTGTSVGTAAVSGAAAAVWGQNPGLSPDDVAAILTGTGVSLGVPADFYNGATAPDVHRLSICTAVHVAAGVPIYPTTCATTPAYGGTRTAWSAFENNVFAACVEPFLPTPIDLTGHNTYALPWCSTDIQTAGGLAPGHDLPCADEQAVTPVTGGVVHPTPPPDPCPHCTYSPAGFVTTVTLPVDLGTSGIYAYPGNIVFKSRTGAVVDRVDISGPTWRRGDVHTLRVSTPTSAYRHVEVQWLRTPTSGTVVVTSDAERR